ncbi:MAG: hypothetical protein O7B35_02560, partial [Deltaproteobacteria bacterium]|nr:hypothetical protein [Deltaproteobacteria bacterium]
MSNSGKATIKIEFFWQSSDRTFNEMLQASFSESKKISIAVAYLSREGLEKVKLYTQSNQSIRIVCGIHG